MGMDIQETSVPFDLDRKLTPREIAQTIEYCRHDVESTIDVWLQKKNEFDAHMALLNLFELPLKYISKTQAQLASIILKAQRRSYDDEWEIRLPETLELKKYKYVADWFLNPVNHNTSKNLKCEIMSVPHVIAWGGLHGAVDMYHHKCEKGHVFVMADVDQLYPTIMVKYGLLSRSVTIPERFENILATSLRLKAEKKKKEREPYKRICNIVYGAEGDKNNNMYDPLHRTLVCVFGQLLVIMLLEMLEERMEYIELIQSNTDGILVKIKDTDFDLFDDIVFEWEQKTHLHMSFDFYRSIHQKDVNNYIAIGEDGSVKSKGAYVKSLSDLDYDLPIVNKAIIEYFVNGVYPDETITSCQNLRDFQKIVKVSSKYLCGWHNGEYLTDKTFRVFASKDQSDTFIGKMKNAGATVEKFANTPNHCFIDNGDVTEKHPPENLDLMWYIDLAWKRLEQFGVSTQYEF